MRATMTLQVSSPSADATSGDLVFTEPTDNGTGEGVEVAHTTAIPALVLCRNDHATDPTTVTVPANGAKAKGVPIADHVRVVAAGDIAYFWLPAEYYATGGKIGLDVSAAADVTFAAVKTGPFS